MQMMIFSAKQCDIDIDHHAMVKYIHIDEFVNSTVLLIVHDEHAPSYPAFHFVNYFHINNHFVDGLLLLIDLACNNIVLQVCIMYTNRTKWTYRAEVTSSRHIVGRQERHLQTEFSLFLCLQNFWVSFLEQRKPTHKFCKYKQPEFHFGLLSYLLMYQNLTITQIIDWGEYLEEHFNPKCLQYHNFSTSS